MNIRFSRAASPLFYFFFQKTRLFFFAVLLSLTSVNAVANNFQIEEEKFRQLGNLVNTVMYMWNTPYGLTNDEILTLVDESGIQSDTTQLGVVIRAVLYEITATPPPKPRLPVEVIEPITLAHWDYLKSLNKKRYIALKALFLVSKTANDYPKASDRLQHTIPLLYALKEEALLTFEHTSVAVASMWLAMEYSELNPMKSVVELEYALPYLIEFDEQYSLETVLDKKLAHLWLAESYSTLNMLNRALTHQKYAIEQDKKTSAITSYSYIGLISTLNRLGRFNEALIAVKEAEKVSINNQSAAQSLFSSWLRVSVYIERNEVADNSHILHLTSDISRFEGIQLPAGLPPVMVLLKMAHFAINGSKSELDTMVDDFIKHMDKRVTDSSYDTPILLNKYHTLMNIYKVRKDFDSAFKYQKKFEELLLKPDAFSQEMDELVNDSPLQRDVTISKLQQMAVLKDKQNLALKAERFQALAFALVAALSTFLLFWFWRRQCSRAKASEFDFLTGALIRKAMFKAIAKPMSSKVTSCLVLIDLDHFKQINDRYGHVVGDEVLSKFGNVVRHRIRKSDKFCRYGGEEFLLYLHDTTQENANALLETIKLTIETHTDWATTESAFSTSFSAGVIEIHGERNINKIIKACDNLLYRAKNTGRGKIEAMSFPAYLSEQM